MQKIKKSLFGLVLLWSLSAQSQENAIWADGVVTGTVLDSNNLPLTQAYILCGSKGAQTDENGEFRISGLAGGEYKVFVSQCTIKWGGCNPCNECVRLGINEILNVIINPATALIHLGPDNPRANVRFFWEKRVRGRKRE